MTIHQRLKHAYARGARIQFLNVDERWQDCGVPGPSYRPGIGYRIHPDDAHLEYGPLSTALRESVLYVDYQGGSTLMAAKHACGGLLGLDAFGDFGEKPFDEMVENDMATLFAAEALANEGL